jgi:hypothetical protein
LSKNVSKLFQKDDEAIVNFMRKYKQGSALHIDHDYLVEVRFEVIGDLRHMILERPLIDTSLAQQFDIFLRGRSWSSTQNCSPACLACF